MRVLRLARGQAEAPLRRVKNRTHKTSGCGTRLRDAQQNDAVLVACGKIVRMRKVFVAWVEKRAYIRKCRTLLCGADRILPREERNRLFSS